MVCWVCPPNSNSSSLNTLSNTAKSEKTNNVIDDPDQDVTYSCFRDHFSLGNAINKP